MSLTNFGTESLLNDLKTMFEPDQVVNDQAEMDAQSLDVWWMTRYLLCSDRPLPRPLAIVFLRSTDQVVRLVRFCYERKIPLIPRGGGAGDCGGALPVEGAIVADLTRMDKILELHERSLTVRVQPGIIQKHLEEYLNRRGYTMNHLPASFSTSTLGGFISTNGTGVLSSKYGKISEMIHQLEVVLPCGTVFRSLPVRHHSTGPDYSRLFIGAEGTLGIITEAVCKIHPLPEVRAFGTFLFPGLTEGIEAGRRVMVSGLQPSLIRLYDEKDTRHVLRDQYGLQQEGSVLLIGFDGYRKVVAALQEVAHDILQAA